MKTTLKFMALLGMAALATGCSSTPDVVKQKQDQEKKAYMASADHVDEVLDNIPSWYMAPPKSNDAGFYAVSTSTSATLEMAMTKARINSEFELAKKYHQIVSGNERSFTSETTSSSSNSSKVVSTTERTIDKLVANADLSNYEIEKSKVMRDGTQFRVYLLAFMPYDSNNDGNDDLIREIKAEASDAFKDLERRTSAATSDINTSVNTTSDAISDSL